MPARIPTEAATAVAATTGLGALHIDLIEAGLSVVIAILSIGVLLYRFLINRREWRDGRRRENNKDLPDL